MIATDEYGCEAESIAYIDFDYNNIVLIPNAFSPNGDGENDIFRLRGQNIIEVELYLYNRWGQQVYENISTDLDEGWDGKQSEQNCEIGTYVYYAKVRFINDTEEFFKGNVTLIR